MGGATGTTLLPKIGGKGRLTMERAALELVADWKTGPLTWHAVGRVDREHLTSYGKDLQRSACLSGNGPGCNVRDQYNQGEIRELFADFDLGERVWVRLGKQQVVFGETDFFHPNDLLHGFDNRWRLFGEPESDELRKPLVMANVKVLVPEADGSLQVVVIPSWNRKIDMGNTYDIYGGRWSATPNMGVDFLAGGFSMDYEHPEGSYKDTTGAIRWSGLANDGRLNYALMYQRVHQPEMALNPCGGALADLGLAAPRDATGCSPGLAYKRAPNNKALGDFFYPTIDVFGASISGESAAIDAVLNMEVAYQKGRLFNTNSHVTSGAGIAALIGGDLSGVDFGPNGAIQPANYGGMLGPIVKKDVILTTFRMDKQLRIQEYLGTNAPSLMSVQVFDSWVQNFRSEDDIVAGLGHAAKLKEHSTIATAFVQFPYMSSRLVYTLAYGRELQAGNSFFIPSVDFAYGKNWRFSANAVMFFTKDARTDNFNTIGKDTSGFAALNNHDYLTVRATYQF